MNETLCITFSLPGVINDDVFVSGGCHAAVDHSLGRGTDIGLVHFTGKVIPAVPTHRGCRSELRGRRIGLLLSTKRNRAEHKCAQRQNPEHVYKWYRFQFHRSHLADASKFGASLQSKPAARQARSHKYSALSSARVEALTAVSR